MEPKGFAGVVVQRPKPGTSHNAPDTFGRANRPSTPIQGIISNTYANIAADEVNQKYELAAKNYKVQNRQKLVPGDTKAR